MGTLEKKLFYYNVLIPLGCRLKQRKAMLASNFARDKPASTEFSIEGERKLPFVLMDNS
ncbi:MAG: hypothetical protein ICV81_19670 [Flavisolibacter sp.]|nr:hypothetical protein [Flavisolibacter sp.]MBD0368589.1 hypothetical protein [Flavisolibacter sp.]